MAKAKTKAGKGPGADGGFRDRVKELRRVPASELRANPRNWRRHPAAQAAALRGVLEEVGWADALIAYEGPDGLTLIDGHLRQDIVGDQEVPVLVLDVDEAEADKLLLTLDPLAAMAERDKVALAELMASVETTNDSLQEMLDSLGAGIVFPGAVDEDDVPEVPEPVTQPGDLWELGRHRLLCGDCTRPEAVERLVGAARIHSMVTDPPYGVDYGAKTEVLSSWRKGTIQPKIEGDDLSDYRTFFCQFLETARAHLSDYNTAYIFMGDKELHNLRLAAEEAGFTWSAYLIWVKNTVVLCRQDYLYQHEQICYGWCGKHKFFGAPSSTVLEFPKPHKSDLHPTMKPVALCAKLICDGSPMRGMIYDPFAGSGSTLIAAEQTGRSCMAMEIDPHYCDVIVRRWEQFTGAEARRV